MSAQHPSDRTTTYSAGRRGEADTEPSVPAVQTGLGLNASQVVGSALAAVSAAVAASYLGVAGTIIGAAVASVVATIGSAVYTASLRRGHEVVLRTGTTRPVGWSSRLRSSITGLPWRTISLGAAAALVLALGTLTVLERYAGSPVSAIAGSTSGAGTTLGSVISGDHDQQPTEPSAPAPSPDESDGAQQDDDRPDPQPGDEPVDEPAEEPTAEPTDDPSEEPTAEPTQEPTEEPSEEPTAEPTEEEPTAEPTEEPTVEPGEDPATP